MGTILHQFEMSKDSCHYVFKSGKIAVFEAGFYRTTVESEIKELNDEIAAGIGAIWVPIGGTTVDSDDIDPIAVMKRKIIEEYLTNQARSLSNGESTSDRSGGNGVGMANSITVAPITAGAIAAGNVRAVTPGSIRVGSK